MHPICRREDNPVTARGRVGTGLPPTDGGTRYLEQLGERGLSHAHSPTQLVDLERIPVLRHGGTLAPGRAGDANGVTGSAHRAWVDVRLTSVRTQPTGIKPAGYGSLRSLDPRDRLVQERRIGATSLRPDRLVRVSRTHSPGQLSSTQRADAYIASTTV